MLSLVSLSTTTARTRRLTYNYSCFFFNIYYFYNNFNWYSLLRPRHSSKLPCGLFSIIDFNDQVSVFSNYIKLEIDKFSTISYSGSVLLDVVRCSRKLRYRLGDLTSQKFVLLISDFTILISFFTLLTKYSVYFQNSSIWSPSLSNFLIKSFVVNKQNLLKNKSIGVSLTLHSLLCWLNITGGWPRGFIKLFLIKCLGELLLFNNFNIFIILLKFKDVYL